MKSLQTIYEGKRDSDGKLGVTVTTANSSYSLPWRLDLRNHSPTGLESGYCGSGPAQCALAILADFLENDEQARGLYQDFKFKVIAGLRLDYWRLTGAEIIRAIDGIIRERAQR